MNKWPDGTPRSRGNVFDWRSAPGEIIWSKLNASLEQSKSGTKARELQPKPFHVFSKARREG